MRVTKLKLGGRNNSTLVELPLVAARPSDRYQVLSVDGLGPPEFDVAISPTHDQGGVYQRRQAHSRQLVILIGLQPAWSAGETPESLRTTLYSLLGGGTQNPIDNDSMSIQLFEDDEAVGYISGYASKFEINPFTKQPQVQITVECPDPLINGASVLSPQPSTKDHFTIDYPGTAPTGFFLQFDFTAPVNEFYLSMGYVAGSKPWMHITEPFVTGDRLTISTIAGLRSITKKSAGVTTNIIRALTADSTWLQLAAGQSEFWTSNQNFNWGPSNFIIPKYWGI